MQEPYPCAARTEGEATLIVRARLLASDMPDRAPSAHPPAARHPPHHRAQDQGQQLQRTNGGAA